MHVDTEPLCLRSVRRLASVVVMLLALCGVMSSPAAGRSMASQSVVLHSRFTPVPALGFLSSTRYVFLVAGDPAQSDGVLVDASTGARTPLSFAAGCAPTTIAGSEIVLSRTTGKTFIQELYDIPTGQTSPFTPSPALQQPPLDYVCPLGNYACPPAIADIGTDWVALNVGSGDEHLPDLLAFQNLQTGQAVADPSGGSTTVNLNSPGLVAKVCAPLSVPTVSFSPYGDRPGSLTAVSCGYEIASGDGGVYLERCGSHLHEHLTSRLARADGQSDPTGCAALACPPPANAHAIVWAAAGGRLSGIFLPSRQRFSIPVPAHVDPSSGTYSDYALALTSTTLYLNVGAEPGHGGTWSIPAPAPPPPSRQPRSPDWPAASPG